MTGLNGTFVSAETDAADFDQLQPLFDALLERPLNSVADIRQWLLDASDLSALISECSSRRQIEHSCHTDDEEIEKRYLHFVENISPKVKPLQFKLQQKLLDSPHAGELTDPTDAQLLREWKADVELFREENIPLQTQVTKQTTQYGKLSGQMIVDFRGEQVTLQQLARYLEEPDRATREEAWTISSNRRLQDRKAFDDIFDELMKLRQQIAVNSDLSSYRDYVWKSFCRFDYTVEDCKTFSDAIEEVCVPKMGELNQAQKVALDVESLRPWDLAVDAKSRPPLKPFPADDASQMLGKVKEVFDRIDPDFGRMFGELKPTRNLDIDSRKGKRPGGYQSSLEVVREPFIFMNAAGVHRDVETMLHEAGHAFHYLAARDQPLVYMRHSPLEFAEVASMSMELLGCDQMDVFYSDADAARARRKQFEGILRFFPWMATVDSFQHWLYENPAANADERTEAWLQIYGRFSDTTVDWSGLDEARAVRWQPQLHIFHYPFYYVEYGIAQLGAIQVWQNYRKDPAGALKKLREAFALGGSRSLPQLFETAGIRFDFSIDTLKPAIEAVSQELTSLPE